MNIYFIRYYGRYDEDGYMTSPYFLSREDAEQYLKDHDHEYGYEYQYLCEAEVVDSYTQYRKEELAEEIENLKRCREEKDSDFNIPASKKLRRRNQRKSE